MFWVSTAPARGPAQKVSKPAPPIAFGTIGITISQICVRPLRSGSLPRALAASPSPPSSTVRPPEREHQPRSENEASCGRGGMRRKQEVDAKGEQRAMGQEAPPEMGLLLVAEKAEHLP